MQTHNTHIYHHTSTIVTSTYAPFIHHPNNCLSYSFLLLLLLNLFLTRKLLFRNAIYQVDLLLSSPLYLSFLRLSFFFSFFVFLFVHFLSFFLSHLSSLSPFLSHPFSLSHSIFLSYSLCVSDRLEESFGRV
ncbi:hypothetical protein CSUI_010594 [Cystoisospora suis]|uniref:Transmembrane protein n=1 Tax=Cystoisospora suis TaxID=483139 RepID=A0A2C6KGI9_9APIC|nr:hypothetical protein CSUI_010594 [Cystoisospora suis]